MSRLALPRRIPASSASSRLPPTRSSTYNVSPFSTSSRWRGYEDTVKNLKIGSHTRVIYQGFTGRQATANAKESIEYGTQVVGGVKPGFTGEHLDLPVLPSVREAVEALKPDASAVYVPGGGTVAAIAEAIENEISLVVAVAEHIPIHDIMRIQQMLRTQSKTRFVGANCPGIISTHGRCRIGFQPLPFFMEGKIGIVAKSGTLSYEAVASTTRAGLGQTYGISIGGDVLAGTDFVDAFQVFEHDEDTEGVIMVGEIGGTAELDAAEWIRDYKKRTPHPKPFLALIGGIEAPHGRIMGHAGAWAAPGEPDAAEKIRALEKVGVEVVDHPEKFGDRMKVLLAQRERAIERDLRTAAGQRRGYHTMRRTRPRLPQTRPVQRRSLYLKESDSLNMLKERGYPISESRAPTPEYLVAVSVDREAKQPCIIASPSTDPIDVHDRSRKFPFAYGSDEGSSDSMAHNVASHIGVSGRAEPVLKKLITDLVDIFMTKEAFLIETKFALGDDGGLQIQGAEFGFDDAAFKSSGRQKDVHALRDTSVVAQEELEAEKEGMIYVKLDGEGSLGTIVNGAGLAMNTVDALMKLGGHPANFLDTGGKATSETIKAGFKIVASDPRVKAIFVNIFGGITLGDMIANGIILAFKDLDLKVPVVVRIRGTNEHLGQQMIQDSGLKLDAFDSFDEAARRAIALASGTAVD